MTQRTTKAQRREWHERVTAMPTRADIDRCIECWPKGWEDKCAFRNGQVATLLAEVERQRADNERLRAREAALVAERDQAMTSERLEELTREHDAAIDALWESAEDVYRDDYMDARSLWFELLAEVERLRTALTELAEKLDAETDYSAGRIESLLKRCAVQRHRAHVAEQQRDAAMKVVRAVADGEVYHDSKGGMLMVASPDALLAKARALVEQE